MSINLLVIAVVHSSCLFGAESYSGQRERKSVWQGFQYKSKICELVSGKLSKYLYIHARVTRAPPRDFAFWAKSLRRQQKKVNGNCLQKCVEGMTNKARKL